MNDLKIKKLEMIQSIISRLNSNSFTIKSWCITIISAIGLFSISALSYLTLLLGMMVIAVFWIMDSYYLSKEKEFISLYDEVVDSHEIVDFKLVIPEKLKITVFEVLFSKSQVLLYPILMLILIIIIVIISQ